MIWAPNSQLAAALAFAAANGAQEIRRRALPGFGAITLLVLRGPADLASANASQRLRTAAPGAEIALQDSFSLSQTPRLYADAMLNWPGRGQCGALPDVAIGMLDGPVNVTQIAGGDRRVARKSFMARGKSANAAALNHGTAIAALLIGGRLYEQLGFARGARLHAAAVFWRRKDGGTPETILSGMDWLMRERVRLINLSFAGPRNRVLDLAFTIAARKGHILIAAAGLRGRGVPSPAGAPAVIAVNALDAANKLEAGAATGPYIEFVAPGVDLWLPKASGQYAYVTGSSFAAPVVTGIAARLLARHKNLSLSVLRVMLRKNSVDLGPPGRDDRFGYGLVQARFAC